jgi:membrane protein CcdC involved in cytochrome C biogenesis
MIVAALAFVGLAMTALLLRALFTGEFAGVVFIIGFAIFFGWPISGFIRRNKPRNYTFDSVPAELLS